MSNPRDNHEQLAKKFANAASDQKDRFLDGVANVQGWIEVNKLKATLEGLVTKLEKDVLSDTLSERLKLKEAISTVDRYKNATIASFISSSETKQIECIRDLYKRFGVKDINEFKNDLNSILEHESKKKLTSPNQSLIDQLTSAMKAIDAAQKQPAPDRPEKAASDPGPKRYK